MRTGRPPRPLEERFKEKFKEGPSDSCWMWNGARHPQGYGLIKRKDGAQLRANRVSWEVYNGPIPDGLMVCHKCDNPGCVNPNHLFLGTGKDNQKDSIAKGRGADHKGELNGSAKLTAEQVIEIFKMRDISQNAIAKQYGVTQTTISLIKRGERWGWLTNECNPNSW